MAEELFQGQGGVSWWNSPRNMLFSSSGWPTTHELISLRSSDNETSDYWNQDLLLDSGRRSEENYHSNFPLDWNSITDSDVKQSSSFGVEPEIQIPMSSASYTNFLQTLFDTDSSSPLPLLHNNNHTPNTATYSNANSTHHSQFQLPSSLTNHPAYKQQHEQGKDLAAVVPVVKKASNELSAAFKRPRIETPSPLPTFKVRKEKLGDRITALQQMVSPFGKTDTASVLHEAIDYIKFLHDQVNALSTPYLKYGSPSVQRQQGGKAKDEQGLTKDLKTRGLCLVPISSTFPVAAETTTDFWTPTFEGGSFR